MSEVYPSSAGFKREGTSQESAGRVTAETLRLGVLDALTTHGPMTADECASKMSKSILSIRPRFSELLALGKIVDTGEHRKNESGHSATVWDIIKQHEQTDFGI